MQRDKPKQQVKHSELDKHKSQVLEQELDKLMLEVLVLEWAKANSVEVQLG